MLTTRRGRSVPGLRQIRNSRKKSRKKSLQVIAGLAGISKSKLSRIERGEIALDSRAEIVALANALRIAPSELTELRVPAPSNGHAESAVDAVRLALMAIGRQRPGGQADKRPADVDAALEYPLSWRSARVKATPT